MQVKEKAERILNAICEVHPISISVEKYVLREIEKELKKIEESEKECTEQD